MARKTQNHKKKNKKNASMKAGNAHKTRSQKTHGQKPRGKNVTEKRRDSHKIVNPHESLHVKNHEILLYGTHACQHALLNSSRKINRIYIADGHDLLSDQKMKDAFHDAEIVDRHFFRDHFPQDMVHQNIAIIVEKTRGISLDHYLKTDKKEKDIVVILDQVTDPHNIGAIMRSANVFGAGATIVQDRNSPDMNGLIAKTACGGVEYVDYIQVTNIARALDDLKEAGYWCLGLDERGTDSVGAAVKNAGQKIALVMGAEGAGLRRLVAENCDLLVSIPVYGQVPCLNVSNAAAVALSETASAIFSNK